METIDVIRKLIGPITPVADSAIDEVRFENLKEYCRLSEQMVLDIAVISRENESQFASVRQMGVFAERFISDIKNV